MHLGLTYRNHLYLKKEIKTLANLLFFKLIRYVNSNYVNDFKNKKLIMGHYFFFYEAIVSWYKKKQCTVSTSTTKVKYIALGHTACERVWIKKFFNKLNIVNPINICIFHKDNKTNIILTKNAKSQANAKHINVQHHYICKLLANKKIIIKWICSANILASGFRKSLSIDKFCQY